MCFGSSSDERNPPEKTDWFRQKSNGNSKKNGEKVLQKKPSEFCRVILEECIGVYWAYDRDTSVFPKPKIFFSTLEYGYYVVGLIKKNWKRN